MHQYNSRLSIHPSKLARTLLQHLSYALLYVTLYFTSPHTTTTSTDVIMCHFEGRLEPPPPFPLDVTCPFFVSWEKQDRGNSGGKGSLRGCIGTLAPQPLARLRDYARSSAFNDRRFRCVSSTLY
jgi:AMMECR1